MNAPTSLNEYVEIPMKELVESSTNPRKSFDEVALDELAASIRSKKTQKKAQKTPGKPESAITSKRVRK